jgi:hypothetical protein
MMKAEFRLLIVLTILAATMIGTGCNRDLAILETAKITRVVLTYPKGEMVVTNAHAITDLTQAMRKAQVDNTLYDTAMTLRLEFFCNDTSLVSVSAGGPLFRLGKNQYYERSGTFQEVIQRLIERDKAPNKPSERTR